MSKIIANSTKNLLYKTSLMKNINNTIKSKPTVYIVDFLNIFSDFREIKYKKDNIDFHSVKHSNKEQDTYDFFKLFFTKYIDYVHIDKSSMFYFVMKKLNDYEVILDNIMKTHYNFNMKFIIIEDKYENDILDKNKDDFLCQYFFYILQKNNKCILISNDKYRDKKNYIKLFNFDIFIRVIKIMIYRQIHKCLSILFFTYNREVLVCFSIGIIINISFFF